MRRAADQDADFLAWVRLARTPRIGPVTFFRLIETFGNAAEALEALPELARQRKAPAPNIPSTDAIEAEMEACARARVSVLRPEDADYSQALSCIPDPPPLLYARGDVSLMQKTGCAVVGSRNASAAGLRFTQDISGALGSEGLVITSGLARGIDGAAHRAALDTGTIAVLAGGLDQIYPPEHADLHAAIVENGLLLSETPLGVRPTARDFPRRNRLVSGLSLGTLVVEAALRSGSLITARLASEQGREVMAVPGSPLDPRAQGTNRLLRDGAHLIQSAEDVLDILASLPAPVPPVRDTDALRDTALPDLWPDAMEDTTSSPQGAEMATEPHRDLSDEDRLMGMISTAPVHVDKLARQSGLPAGVVNRSVLEFELLGKITRLPGGLIQAALR